MSEELWDILQHPPVQVKCEAVNEDSSRKLYARMYISSDRKGRFDYESRLIENGETVEHVAYICLPTMTYLVNLTAKTYKAMGREIGIDSRSLSLLKVIGIIHEEPDPHLFLITADLRPE